MIIFDFDGVLVKSGAGEKIIRRLINKVPQFFFSIKEIAEVLFNIRPKSTGASNKIKDLKKNGFLVGIFTDRALWSLLLLLKNNKDIGLNWSDFDFIQARKSFLNRFCGINSLVGKLKNHWLTTISEIKPHPDTFKEIQKFAESRKISGEEILVVDDTSEIRDAVKDFGFSATKPDMLIYF